MGLLRLTLLCTLLASAVAIAAAQNSLIVSTEYGLVEGHTKNDVDIWLGMPYAHPPTGQYRFQPPQPADGWSGVRQALLAGNICPQLHGTLIKDGWLGDEDCLYLNVYAPSNRSLSDPLPVFVWLYGGGWEMGDGIEFGLYDGKNLANKHNVIVVTFNYRLGSLGFLALPAFANENPHGLSGNYGLLDQVFALQWVQTNIRNFGGDPTKVTIGGESAGAFSGCIHLVSPMSKGLFRNVIMESGTCSSVIFFQGQAESYAWSEGFVNAIGCNANAPEQQLLQCLRGLDLNSVMGPSLNYSIPGYKPLMFPAMPWGSTIDGVFLTQRPIDAIARGEFNPVEGVIMGTNHDEGTIFVPRLSKVVPAVHTPLQWGDMNALLNHFFGNNQTINAMVDAAYPDANYDNATDQLEVMLRDFFFVCPSSRAMLTLAEHGPKTYLYQFNYRSDWIEVPFMGVYHSAELEYVFDNQWPPIIHTFNARDQAMADAFGYYWMNLVKYSNPNGPTGQAQGQLTWPSYSANNMSSISLDQPTTLVTNLYEDKCRVWDEVVQYVPPVKVQQMKEHFVEIALA